MLIASPSDGNLASLSHVSPPGFNHSHHEKPALRPFRTEHWKFLLMHRLRTFSSIFRLRIAALLLFVNWLLAVVTAILLEKAMFTGNRALMAVASGLAISYMIFVVIQWIAGASTTCPLCQTAVLAPRACMKHRRAKRLLGSHRLQVAAQILFRNRFCCPYCNESTTLELRETIRRSHGQRTQVD